MAGRIKTPRFVHPTGEGGGGPRPFPAKGTRGRVMGRSPDSRPPRSPSRGFPPVALLSAQTETRSGLSQWRGPCRIHTGFRDAHPHFYSLITVIVGLIP